MNKKMVLVATLLVSVAAAVSGTDFEERISRNIWYRDYFNEVIYRKDRNIIVEHQPRLTEKHCMQHTVPMMNQKKKLCRKQSVPMNLT